jgi:hypothetical protein
MVFTPDSGINKPRQAATDFDYDAFALENSAGTYIVWVLQGDDSLLDFRRNTTVHAPLRTVTVESE